MKYIAIFKSKTDLFEFINYMAMANITTQTVPAPQKTSNGCGLGASFEAKFFHTAVNIINKASLKSLYGIYKVTILGKRRSISKIYPY